MDAQVQFYTEALGLTVRERATDDTSHYAFLTDAQPIPGGVNVDGEPVGMHHRLVLRQARDGSAPDRSGPLDHFAFEVDDEAELLAFVALCCNGLRQQPAIDSFTRTPAFSFTAPTRPKARGIALPNFMHAEISITSPPPNLHHNLYQFKCCRGLRRSLTQGADERRRPPQLGRFSFPPPLPLRALLLPSVLPMFPRGCSFFFL